MSEQPPIASFSKDPSENLPYAIDWTPLLPAGETVGSAVWAFPTGITMISQSEASPKTTVRVSGGTSGTNYRVTCTMTTAPSSFVLERSIEFRVTDL